LKPLSQWLLVGGMLATSALAQAKGTALSADQIIDRNVEARGGAEAWRKIQTMAWTGHIEASGNAMPSVPFLMQLKRPDKTRFEIVMQNSKTARIFNGHKGWKVRMAREGGPEVVEFTPEEVSFALDAAGLDGPLMDYKAKGVTVEAQGMGDVEGHRAYQLRVMLPSGAIQQVWIDAQSFLELKYDRQARSAQGQSTIVSVYYRQYQQVEGLTLPMTIETGNMATHETDKMVLERVALNPKLEDSVFAKPIVFKQRSEIAIGETPAPGSAPPVPH
jgi:hypothetical protein